MSIAITIPDADTQSVHRGEAELRLIFDGNKASVKHQKHKKI